MRYMNKMRKMSMMRRNKISRKVKNLMREA